MNNLTKMIEHDNARNAERERDQRFRELVRENPFGKEHWNVTRQIRAKIENPELADLLYKCRDAAIPSVILDDSPECIVPALAEIAKSVMRAEANGGRE